MKFCERFHISPLEYAQLPNKKIDLWLQMLDVENNVREAEDKRKQTRGKLYKNSETIKR